MPNHTNDSNPHGRDFLLNRQAAKLAKLAGQTGSATLAEDLAAVCAALGRAAGTTAEKLGDAAVLDAVEDVEAVLDIVVEGPAAAAAAALRGVLNAHGREVYGEVGSVEELAAQMGGTSEDAGPSDGAGAEDALMAGVGDDLADLAGAAALAGGVYDPAAGEPAAMGGQYDEDAPVRRVLLVAARRSDGHAVSAVEAGVCLEALSPTLGRLGELELLAPPELREGAAVLVCGIDGEDGRLPLEAMPAGHEVFNGVLPVVGVDVEVRAVCVDDEGDDVPLAADGGIDVEALAGRIDVAAVLDGAGDGVEGTMEAIHQQREEVFAQAITEAVEAGDHAAVAELEELAANGPELARDEQGRERLVVLLERRDGGVLDGEALGAARRAAMNTLPRFGQLEEVGVVVEQGRTVLELAVADAEGAQVSARDVAEGTVVWEGTLPFPGVGMVDARLALPEVEAAW